MENDKKDVGWIFDFMYYLQSAVSLEHHAIESLSNSTDKNMKKLWLEIAEKTRRNRSKWMYRYISEGGGQKYCASKHLMQMAQSLKELGNRFTERKEYKLAEECFNESQECEAIFILLNEEGGKNV